jgi:hypothetical protein
MLEAPGFIDMKSMGGRKVPVAAVTKILVEIDPFSENDRMQLA